MESELMLSILSGLAESESISISENNKWSVKRRFQNGTYKISSPPYGYDVVDGKLIVNNEQSAIVRFIFAEILSGKGTQKISDDLNRREIPTKRGGHWRSTTIRGMVCNEKYTGDAIFQKTYTDSSFNRHINNGEKDQYLFKDNLKNNIATVINQDNNQALAGIDKRLEELQAELLKLASTKSDYEDVADEIYSLREKKQKIQVDSAGKDEINKRITDMSIFLREQPTAITEYDESLVRRLVEKVTIYEDKFTVEFKFGVTVDVEE